MPTLPTLELVGWARPPTLVDHRRTRRAGFAHPTGCGLLGHVSDADLATLYNLCRLFVFPSIYEGFGLPAVEAMACGAAVIGANATSIPEVINNPEALFDPRERARDHPSDGTGFD